MLAMRKPAKFVGSVIVILALVGVIGAAAAQPTRAYATDIGVVDYQMVLNNYPDIQKANAAFQAEADQAKKDFDAKSAGLSDKEKQDLSLQLGQQVEQKRREILGPILDNYTKASD